MKMDSEKLTIALDVDDTLVGFTEKICECCEEKFGHPFPFQEVQWGFENYKPEETAFVHGLFRDRDFIRSVPIADGAIEFVKYVLGCGHNVVFCTSTYSNVMTERALYLYDKFPDIHPRNYIMTGRKDLVKADILFDDCLSHIKSSICNIPVLVNKPWNKSANGYVRAEAPFKGGIKSYVEIVRMAAEGMNRQDIYKVQNNKAEGTIPHIVAIVGGSGTGKSTIVKKIVEQYPDLFEQLVTNTTRRQRPGEVDGHDYYFKTKEVFERMIANGELLEYTKYADNYYGMSKDNVQNILDKGKNAITVLDVNGVKCLKEVYPDKIISILIERDKADLVQSIMLRDVPIEDKVTRIVQLDRERIDWNFCDYRVLNIDVDGAVAEIVTLFQ